MRNLDQHTITGSALERITVVYRAIPSMIRQTLAAEVAVRREYLAHFRTEV
jgi:hypothetical protein